MVTATKKWASERDRQAERKREDSRQSRLVVNPKYENRRRRRRLEKNDEKWLLYYFGKGCGCEDEFWYPFTAQQKEMIQAIRNAIEFGGDQSFAASRGEGKTTISERMLLKLTLQGVISYSVLFAATGPMADNSLDAVKTAIEENVFLLADTPKSACPSLRWRVLRSGQVASSSTDFGTTMAVPMKPLAASSPGRDKRSSSRPFPALPRAAPSLPPVGWTRPCAG